MALLDLLVRPFPTVRSHVCRDTAGLRELAVADAAVKRFLTAVGPAVRCQVGSLGQMS